VREREQGAPTNKLEGLLQLSAAVQAGLRDLCRPLCHKCSVEWLPCQLLRDDLQRHAYAGGRGKRFDSNDNAASPPPPCTRADPKPTITAHHHSPPQPQHCTRIPNRALRSGCAVVHFPRAWCAGHVPRKVTVPPLVTTPIKRHPAAPPQPCSACHHQPQTGMTGEALYMPIGTGCSGHGSTTDRQPPPH